MATDEPKQQEPAKKTSAKKTADKKTTAKNTADKKTAAKNTAAKKAPAKHAPQEGSSGTSRGNRSRAPKPSQIADNAVRQLAQLTGRTPEGVTGLERTDDGWTVSIDVLDLRRVPETTDVLACYEVEVDEQGDLVGYRRVHRYVRGSAGEEHG